MLCRRVVDRRDDPEGAFVERYFNADSTEVAGGLFGEIRERALVEKHRVFVESAHHAADAVVEQLSFGTRFDIVVAHLGDDVGERAYVRSVARSRGVRAACGRRTPSRTPSSTQSSGTCQRLRFVRLELSSSMSELVQLASAARQPGKSDRSRRRLLRISKYSPLSVCPPLRPAVAIVSPVSTRSPTLLVQHVGVRIQTHVAVAVIDDRQQSESAQPIGKRDATLMHRGDRRAFRGADEDALPLQQSAGALLAEAMR